MHFQVNNFRMAYDEAGTGIPLLFVHGFPLSRKMWAPQIQGLADIAHVMAPDLRGFGESEAVPGPYLMSYLSDDLDDFLNQAGIVEPVVLCGMSMGGYIAMDFYRRHAPRIRALVLTSTRAKADSEEARKNREKSIEAAREKGVEAVVESMLPKLMAKETYHDKPDLVERVRKIIQESSLNGVIGAQQGMLERIDSSFTLAEVELPVLIIHGEGDQIVPLSEAKAMRELIGSSEGGKPDSGHQGDGSPVAIARLETIPEAGHLISLEQPERFNQILRGFLESLM